MLRERARALFCSSFAARSSSWGMLVVKGPPSRASGVGSQNRETSSSQRHSLCRRVSFLKSPKPCALSNRVRCYSHSQGCSSSLPLLCLPAPDGLLVTHASALLKAPQHEKMLAGCTGKCKFALSTGPFVS